MTEPTKRLAIVGSVELARHPDAWRLLREVMTRYAPAELVSGGSNGIDSMAAKVARDAGIPVRTFKPEAYEWDPGDGRIGFLQRNAQMAEYCTHLVRIVAASAPRDGTTWLRDRVRRMGKPIEEFTVNA
jgi:hypothetical protein